MPLKDSTFLTLFFLFSIGSMESKSKKVNVRVEELKLSPVTALAAGWCQFSRAAGLVDGFTIDHIYQIRVVWILGGVLVKTRNIFNKSIAWLLHCTIIERLNYYSVSLSLTHGELMLWIPKILQFRLQRVFQDMPLALILNFWILIISSGWATDLMDLIDLLK